MSAPMKTCRKCLLQFANEHVDFRFPEFQSITSLFGIKYKLHDHGQGDRTPFYVVDLPSEECARKVMSRTVLIKSVCELWGHGNTYEDFYNSVASYPTEYKVPYFVPEKSFKINVETFNKTVTQKDKVQRIEDFPDTIFDFRGKVNLKNPDNIFYLFEYYGEVGSPQPDLPLHIYFGRLIDVGQRDQIKHYHLQNRHFIGNTSMDAGLSLLMSNIGKVQNNHLVFDPFVGTGSLLVACAHHGAYVMGTDIDYLLLHAKAKPSRPNQKKRAPDESIQANLRQYKLEQYYVDAIVSDSSRHYMWERNSIFDAIVTDPPYGIREGARKIGTENEECVISEEDKTGHISQKLDYHLRDVFKDLLNFAAKFLTMNGRLVYWFPVYRPEYREENIPTHPCLTLVSNSEQVLSTKISRRLIAMEKTEEYQDICGVDVEAQVEIDHYKDSSFRQKYFSYDKEKEKKIKIRSAMESSDSKLRTDLCTGDDSKVDCALSDLKSETTPYGIREGARKIGTENEECVISEEDKTGHISQKLDYHLRDVFKDLLNFAAKFLTMNGRLVYWFSVYRPEYREENIPTHPCLTLVSNSEQVLSTKISRRLIAMEKTEEYQDICGVDVEAQVEIDHYKDSSFRQKYFSYDKEKEKKIKIRSVWNPQIQN